MIFITPRSYLPEEAEKLKGRDIDELAESFKEIYSEILQASAEENPFLGWILSQAPVSIIKPNSKDTAFAADNGQVYINPAFINAVARTASEKGYSAREIYQLYGYIIAHEMAHIMLQHPWTLKKFFKIQEHIPFEIKRDIANISTDYIINTTFCNVLYNDAPHHILNIIDSRKALESVILNMKNTLDTEKVLEEINTQEDIEEKMWEDLYYIITKHIKADALKHYSMYQAGDSENIGQEESKNAGGSQSKQDGDSQEAGKEQKQKNNQGIEQTSSKKKVFTAHGEEKEIGEEASVRKGYLEKYKDKQNMPQKDDAERIKEIVEEIKQEFMHKMREAGIEKGGLYRSFVDTLKADTTPIQAQISSILTGVIQGQTRVSAWDRLSRRMPYITPGARIFPKPDMVLFVDVSGSVSDKELSAVISTVKDLLYSQKLGRVLIVPFDVEATGIYEVRSPSDLEDVKIEGGGGTLLSPAVDKVKEELKWGDIAAVATDSAVGDDMDELKIRIEDVVRTTSHPVIWLHFGDERDIKEIINHNGYNIIPMIIKLEQNKVLIKNYRKGVSI